MPFIDDILQFSSLSIIGMEKNTGKTECLNYIINRLQNTDHTFPIKVAITSIGIDGENVDQVTHTHKPEIFLHKGIFFITTEKHYRERALTAEIIDLSDRKTSLGRLVTAQAHSYGNVILSGPNTTKWLEKTLTQMENIGIHLTIIDGALSRKSSGSPIITQSLILTTGAAVSPHLPELVQKTKFVFKLINLPQYITENQLLLQQLKDIEHGVYAIDPDHQLHDLKIPSAMLMHKFKDHLFDYGHVLYISGAITDNILNFLRIQKEIKKTTLIVRDFTRIFAKPENLNAFLNAGGSLQLLFKNRCIAICVNPTSPTGYTINSELLCQTLHQELQIPVYDIVKNDYLI